MNPKRRLVAVGLAICLGCALLPLGVGIISQWESAGRSRPVEAILRWLGFDADDKC